MPPQCVQHSGGTARTDTRELRNLPPVCVVTKASRYRLEIRANESIPGCTLEFSPYS